jgi:hypothetical protein
MNPNKEQIAIAVAIAKKCGLLVCNNPIYGLSGKLEDSWSLGIEGDREIPIPNYFYDLNAMQSAENTLSVRGKQGYISILRNICTVAGCWPETATAAQRAEAFFSTIGKLEE